MKILNINTSTINQNLATTTKQAVAFKPYFDTISFSSKTPEQISLNKEAKDLSKEAYSTFAKGKQIQKQGQKHLEASSQILEKAQKVLNSSRKDFREFSSAFKYAQENRLKASADPFKNTQTIYNKNSIEEYRNGKLLRKATKTDGKIILFEYKKTLTRKVFDSNGRLAEYNENYKAPTKTTSTSDLRLVFEDDCLISCDYGVTQSPNSTNIKKSYEFFLGATLFKVLINAKNTKNGMNYVGEEYAFNDDELTAHYKGVQKDGTTNKAFKEMFGFLKTSDIYAKDYDNTNEESTSVGKIFLYKNSKLQKALIDLNSSNQIRIISKYFTYNRNERPQLCYLNHQKICSTFDFSDDSTTDYDKLVYLG